MPAPDGCHGNAFRFSSTPTEIAAGEAKIDAIEARVKLAFDASAKRPVLLGTVSDVSQSLGPLRAAAARADDELRAVRTTPLVAARALVVIGEMYDAWLGALEAWDPDERSYPQAYAGGTDVEQRLLQEMVRSAERRRAGWLAVQRANAYVAYVGALRLLEMSPPSGEGSIYRARAQSRAERLRSAVLGKPTTSLDDPTSTSLVCRLDLEP